ncbi:hypothetical protein N7528_001191 [Penicillium herquei]|nr:hypothetical protein N7528_001191 [Penicillium herquei]
MSRSVSQRRGRGSKSRISEAQKEELLILCHDWIKWGYNLVSCEYVTRLANALLERDWKLKGEPPGIHLSAGWCYDFCNTHLSLKNKINQVRDYLTGDEEVLTKDWVTNVRSLCNQYDINPENMHTVREIGYFTSKSHHTKAVTLRRPRNPNIDLRPMASAIHSFSGAGVTLAPWAMFKEANPSPYATLARVHIASNKTGWGTQYDWKEWLINHFEPKTRQWDVGRSIWRLMLVDSYHCPIHEDFFLWCRDHKILCISYPSKRRDDLNPFHWGVFKTIERGYKRWLYMRWKTELEKNNNDSCRDNANGQVIVKRREFAGILTKITVAGSALRVAQRKAEAENAWRTGTLFVISSASTGALVNRFEDTQGANMEQLEDGKQEDDYFIVDDEDDFLDEVESSSQTIGNSLYSDGEDVLSSSSESDDSADESYDDCSYAESSLASPDPSLEQDQSLSLPPQGHPHRIGVAVDHLLQFN